MKKKPRPKFIPPQERVPLAIPLPRDLADILGYDPSYISHVNSGSHYFPLKTAVRVLKLAQHDSRLRGLTILHLRPEFKEYLPIICTPYVLSLLGLCKE